MRKMIHYKGKMNKLETDEYKILFPVYLVDLYKKTDLAKRMVILDKKYGRHHIIIIDDKVQIIYDRIKEKMDNNDYEDICIQGECGNRKLMLDGKPYIIDPGVSEERFERRIEETSLYMSTMINEMRDMIHTDVLM